MNSSPSPITKSSSISRKSLPSDSSGIGMLVRYLTTAKQSGGNIRLLKPSKFTVQTLKMVGLLNLFTTFDDTALAVASFQ